MVDPNKTTLLQVSTFINSKMELHEAAVRNGYYVPKLKSKAVTEEYLLGVVASRYWCPRYEEIRLLPCPRPPILEVLYGKLKEVALRDKRTLGMDEQHLPDRGWVLAILSTFKPADEIFKKGYEPPARGQASSLHRTVDLQWSFLEGLPKSKGQSKAHRLSFVNQGKQSMKLLRLREQKARLEQRLEQEKKSMEERKKRKQSRGGRQFTGQPFGQGESNVRMSESSRSPQKR